jgi:branched-chain amino acid transport system substrate-binding protein
MKKRLVTVATLGAALTLAATAGGQGAEKPGGAATKEPYKVGDVTDLSGVARDSYAPVLEGFQLYFKQLNADGGIDGHPVQVVVRDDQSIADKSVAAAIDLATREKVSGIFGLSLSGTIQAVFEAMKTYDIPVVTGFSAIDTTLPPANAIGYATGNIAQAVGAIGARFVQGLARSGKVVCVTINTPGGVGACKKNSDTLRAAGYQTDEVAFPIATADYSPVAMGVVAKKPDAVVAHFGSAFHLRMITALRAAGYTGPYLAADWGTSEGFLKRAAATAGVGRGIYMFSRYVVADSEVAGVAKLREAAKRFGAQFELQNPHVHGWALARVAHEALVKCGFPCGGKGLNAALKGLTVDMHGITGGPVEFSADDHYGTTYWRLFRFDGKENKFVAASDWVKLPSTGLK